MSIYRHSCGGTTVSAQYREDHHERITPRLSEVRSWGRAGGRRFRADSTCAPAFAQAKEFKLKWTKQTTSICCYCAVGRGLIVSTSTSDNPLGKGRAINVEGDPDHPINEGSLCPKGASTWQLTVNDQRPKKPLYRAPHATEWKEVEWEWAMEEIAKRVKESRDKSFTEKNDKGQLVNRTEAMASFGSAAMDNEECWAYQSILRSLGLVYIEHQARL